MRRLIWAVTLVLLGACGDDDGVAMDAGSDTGVDTGVDAAIDTFVPGDAGPTVTWTIRARDLLTGNPVVTARICVRNIPEIECLQVDEMTGDGQIQVPVNAEIQLVSNAIRYFPQLNTYTTGTMDDTVQLDMGKRGNIEPLIAAAGVTVDETKGQLAFLAQSAPGTGIAGVTAALDPMSGMGPFYTMDSLPDPLLMETTEDGLGVFANVDPGDLDVVYTSPTGECMADEGWPGGGANRVATHIEPGHLTIIIARCAS